jgi:hypothetical protein
MEKKKKKKEKNFFFKKKNLINEITRYRPVWTGL